MAKTKEVQTLGEIVENCPMCDAENAPMGWLGKRAQFNCRACGWWYSREKHA